MAGSNENLQKTEMAVRSAPGQEVYEIDLLQLARELLKHWLLIFLAALLCGGIAGGVAKFMIAPTYQSSSMLYVYSKETTLTSLADLQIGSALTDDYMVIVQCRPVMEKVIENLGLDMDYKELLKLVQLSNPSDTRILKITATYTDPEMARQIADEVAAVASDYISDIMEMSPPRFIEKGEVPTEKSAPAVGKTALIAAVLGALLVCAAITVRMVLDDTVKNADDVQKYLGVPVLASVAYSAVVGKNEEKEKSSGKKERKK